MPAIASNVTPSPCLVPQPIFSYWSAPSLWWLDQGPGCPSDTQERCGPIATFSDLAVCQGGPLCPSHLDEITTTGARALPRSVSNRAHPSTTPPPAITLAADGDVRLGIWRLLPQWARLVSVLTRRRALTTERR